MFKFAKKLARNQSGFIPVLSCICRMSTGSKILVNGVNLYYEKVGHGDHAILLIPGGLGSTKTDFTPQLEKLNRDNFTIVGFDPRGYGKSRPPEREFTFDFLNKDADDAAALMEALNIKKYSILGWSDGGNSAAILAAKWRDRINKLVVWGSNSYFTPEELQIYKNVRDISTWNDKMKQPMINVYGKECFEKTWHAWVDIFIDMAKKNADSDGNVDLYQDELSKITAETLIVYGRRDALVPAFHSEKMHKHIKNSRLEVWDDAGHSLHLRYGERFNTLVEKFLLSPSKL